MYRGVFGFPLGYVTRPIKDGIISIKKQYPVGSIWNYKNFFQNPSDFFYNIVDKREKRKEEKFENFVFFNKPIYLPRDTVKYKIVIFNKRGIPTYEKALNLELTNGYGKNSISKNLPILSPYRKGFYTGEFVLHDSLNLKLNQKYFLNEKELFLYENSFEIADYVLNGNIPELTCPNEIRLGEDSLRLNLKIQDEREIPASGFNAKITLSIIDVKKINTPTFYINPILYSTSKELDTKGSLSFSIPDSILPKANYTLKINADFINYANKINSKNCTVNIINANKPAKIFAKNDSVWVESIGNNVLKYKLEYFDTYKNELIVSNINTPHKEKINPFVGKYTLKIAKNEKLENFTSPAYFYYNNETVDNLEIPKINPTFSGERNRNSFSFQVENPSNLPCWIDIFKGNRIIKRIFNDKSISETINTTGRKNYFVNFSYLKDTKIVSTNYKFNRNEKQLDVDLKTKMIASPGEQLNFEISVKDQKGNPVKNADITLQSITQKFQTDTDLSLKTYEKQGKNRKYINSLYIQDKKIETQLYLNNTLKKSIPELSNNQFYRAIFPDSAINIYTQKSREKLTQYTVFVVENGKNKEVQFMYLNKEPVYLKFGSVGQPYSFLIDTIGVKNLEIRTLDKLIQVNSLKLNNGKKNIIIIDPNIKNPKIKVFKRTPELNQEELKTLNRYSLFYSQSFNGSVAYIEQNGRYFLLESNNSIAPINLKSATFSLENNYSINFEPEEGYTVSFDPQKVKLKSRDSIKSYKLHNNSKFPISVFENQVLTKKDLDSMINLSVKKKNILTINDKKADITISGNGKASIYDGNKLNEPLCYFLFKNRDPEFINFSGKHSTVYHDLQPGSYHFYVLFDDKTWIRSESFIVKKEQQTLVNLTNYQIKKPDTLSSKLWDILYENKYTPVSTARKTKVVYYENSNTYNSGLSHIVSGLVTDNLGEPIPGVIIQNKGTNIGVTTDFNGRYSIQTPSNGILIASFIGMVNQEVMINGRNHISIQLDDDAQMLEEVVVVGYASVIKKSLTGSIAVVSQNFTNQLSGKVMGVNVRGANSLITVNGIPQKSQNMADFKNYQIKEILGPETGIALYGELGKYGVINLINSESLIQNTGSSLRKNFRDYGFWEPRLSTNINGKIIGNLRLPDDLTSWKSNLYVFTDKGQTANKSFKIKTFKSLTASSELPRFLIKGDISMIYGQVKNYSNSTLDISSKFYENDSLISIKRSPINSTFKDSVSINSNVKNDSLLIKFLTETTTGEFDVEQKSIPLFPKGLIEDFGDFQYFDKIINYGYTRKNESSDLSLKIFTSKDDIILEEIDKISHYKYFCNEQMASKLLALLLKKELFQKKKMIFKEERQILYLIEKLNDNKNEEGVWSWWNKGNTVDWVTYHVVEVLEKAKKNNYKITLQLDSFLNKKLYEYPQLSNEQKLDFLNLALSQNYNIDYKFFLNELSQKSKLSISELIAFEKLNFQVNKIVNLEKIEKYARQTLIGGLYLKDTLEIFSPKNNSEVITLEYLKLLNLVDSNDVKTKDIHKYFFEKRMVSGWENTYISSKILSELYKPIFTSDTKNNIEVRLDNNSKIIEKFPFEIKLQKVKSINIISKKDIPLFVSISERNFNVNPTEKSVNWSISTSFEGSENKVLKKAEKIKMKVHVHVKKEANYALIEIPIPAGCTYSDNKPNFNGLDFEQFKDKTSIYCKYLGVGSHEFIIELNPQFPGTYTLNPAKIQLMYFPSIYANNTLKNITIK